MEDTAPKPFAFVLMPFDKAFDDIYEFGIRQACDAAGAYCERVDEQIFDGSMMARIYNQIAKSDIIIADMSDKNPNVYYETGYAHALNKRTILLIKDTKDIPFDFKHYSHVVYQGDIRLLKAELTKRVKHYVEHPKSNPAGENPSLVYHIEGNNLDQQAHAYINGHTMPHEGPWIQRLSLDIYNAGSVSPFLGKIQFSVIIPEEMAYNETNDPDTFVLPDRRIMMQSMGRGLLYPGSWHHIRFEVFFADYSKLKGKTFPCCLRISNEFQTREIPFYLTVNLSK